MFDSYLEKVISWRWLEFCFFVSLDLGLLFGSFIRGISLMLLFTGVFDFIDIGTGLDQLMKLFAISCRICTCFRKHFGGSLFDLLSQT